MESSQVRAPLCWGGEEADGLKRRGRIQADSKGLLARVAYSQEGKQLVGCLERSHPAGQRAKASE